MEQYMRRCFDLAVRGAGYVAPNPMVGAVLVYNDQIIGEGWHQRYGEAHAEVNAVRSVSGDNQALIAQSTLYCSLEPCAHHGKTPPCVDLVLAQKIPRVVISNLDPNPLVAGKSVEKMRTAGVEVIAGVLEAEGAWLNRVFFHHITVRRPFVALKWAESSDHYLGLREQRIAISGPLVQRLVHRWRMECGAVLVGTTTALTDRPRLDIRHYSNGPQPLRIALDFQRKIPLSDPLLDDSQPTLILGPNRSGAWQQTDFQEVNPDNWIQELLQILYDRKKTCLLVEGGASVHQQFLDAGLWDEIRRIRSTRQLGVQDGIGAPLVPQVAARWESYRIGDDEVEVYSKR
jgi:diaminohydroxyphosphoribosylaminopyrimidine deaminase / 5-amino-6-(5-phosphoribosylamino)uracil reductase